MEGKRVSSHSNIVTDTRPSHCRPITRGAPNHKQHISCDLEEIESETSVRVKPLFWVWCRGVDLDGDQDKPLVAYLLLVDLLVALETSLQKST